MIGCSQDEATPIEVHDLDQAAFQRHIQNSPQPYVLVSCFQIGCPLFAIELPNLVRLQQTNSDEVMVMLVSLDEADVAHRQLAQHLMRQGITADVFHFDPQEAMPFFADHITQWDGHLPLNLIYERAGRLVAATNFIDDKEVQLIVHADQSFPR